MNVRLLIILLGISSAALAHGPTPQKTDESIVVKSSPSEVWKRISEPCGIAKWNPEVTACDVVNEKQQTLTLKNGKKVNQEIDELATAEMTLSYRLSGEIDIAALPVSSLNGRIKVSADGGGAKVSWTARYYRAFTGNEPPPGQDDETAKEAIDAFVKAGLNGLTEHKTSSAIKSSQPLSACAKVKAFLGKLGWKWDATIC